MPTFLDNIKYYNENGELVKPNAGGAIVVPIMKPCKISYTKNMANQNQVELELVLPGFVQKKNLYDTDKPLGVALIGQVSGVLYPVDSPATYYYCSFNVNSMFNARRLNLQKLVPIARQSAATTIGYLSGSSTLSWIIPSDDNLVAPNLKMSLQLYSDYSKTKTTSPVEFNNGLIDFEGAALITGADGITIDSIQSYSVD